MTLYSRMTDLSGTKFSSADLESDKSSMLFDYSSQGTSSHTITVEGTAFAFIAVGMVATDIVEIDMVLRTPLGDVYEPLRAFGGQTLQLVRGRNVIPMPVEGRYRARIVSGTPGTFLVAAYPTKVEDEYWKLVASATKETVVANTDGSIKIVVTPTSTSNVYTISADVTQISNVIASTPAAATNITNAIISSPANITTLTTNIASTPAAVTNITNAIAASSTDTVALANAIGASNTLTTDQIQNKSTIDPGTGPATGTLTQALDKVAVNFTRLGV